MNLKHSQPTLKVKHAHNLNEPYEWEYLKGSKVTLPAHKQFFFAAIMILLMVFNGMLFTRFQRLQEQMADLVEDSTNEAVFSKMRNEIGQSVMSSDGSG